MAVQSLKDTDFSLSHHHETGQEQLKWTATTTLGCNLWGRKGLNVKLMAPTYVHVLFDIEG